MLLGGRPPPVLLSFLLQPPHVITSPSPAPCALKEKPMTKCNRDCFNCPFPDCILPDEEMTKEEIRRAQKRAYYYRNKDKVNAASVAWAKANADKVREAAKRRRQADPEKYRTHCRNYYNANRERILAQKRAAYQRKKEITNEP